MSANTNHSYPLNAKWQQNPDLLYQKLTEIEGVESISFSADKQTIYIKALQKGFDQEAAEKIITGV